MCQTAVVDEHLKNLITRHGANFRRAAESPFGAEDEIGMLNLIDGESRRSILSRADAGTMLDLSVDYFVGMPSWSQAGDPGYQIWMTHTPHGTVIDDSMGVGDEQNRLVSYSGDAISMYTHCGTHVDALNHFGYAGEIFNRFTVDEHLGSRNWTVAGADRQPPVLARGVLLDVAGAKGMNTLPPNYGITAQDLRECQRRQGLELRHGDVVMIRTGQMALWPTPAYMEAEPGLVMDAAHHLARHGAALIGADTISLEQRPSADPDNWNAVHCFLLAEAGIAILEVANLEALAAERLYEFAFFGAAIRLRGSTAAPIRPVAMPLCA
ncbi:cyclase family protein [Actinomadura sp. NPDC048955]|uniref:cyclase family protein n=1 Tax=Actinomadura sp. NPDC048955 TaxID=3158228 RepID=UPI0033E3CAE2